MTSLLLLFAQGESLRPRHVRADPIEGCALSLVSLLLLGGAAVAALFLVSFVQRLAQRIRVRRAHAAERAVQQANARLAEVLLRTPSVAIGSAVEGALVRVSGRARHSAALTTSPVSGRACIAWRDGVTREGAVDFFVEDASGRALVVATSGCAVHVVPESGADGHGVDGLIASGQSVVVLGVASWEDLPDTFGGIGYRENALRRTLVLRAPARGPIIVSDGLFY